jgi:hypothetical protein
MTIDLPFIDPTAGGSKAKIALAPRPIDLAGKVVGLLDNTKEQADVILETVADTLRSSTRWRRKYRWPSPPSAGEGPARCAVCTTQWSSKNAVFLPRCS